MLMTKRSKGKADFVTLLCVIFAIFLVLLICLFNLSKHNIYNNEKAISSKIDYYTATEFKLFPDEENHWSISAENLSGAITIQSFSIAEKDEVISVSANIDVQKGNFKIVLVDTDNEILLETVLEGVKNCPLRNYRLTYGNYAIKVIGKEAKISGDFTFVPGKDG